MFAGFLVLYLDGVKLQGEQKFLEAIDYFKKAYETNEEHLSGEKLDSFPNSAF